MKEDIINAPSISMHDGEGAPSPSDSLLQRYLDLFPLRKTQWHEQDGYVRSGKKVPFLRPEGQREEDVIEDATIRRHLARSEEFWIASRCDLEVGRPVTSLLLLDFDAGDGRAAAWERLQQVVSYFGRVPLLYSSPGTGYHAIWFWDSRVPLASYIDLNKPQSQGILAEVLRHVLGRIGPGICEIYPQNGQVVRWPLGTRQYRADPVTGEPVVEEDLEVLLAVAEHHRDTVPPLAVEHLRSLRPSPFLVTSIAERVQRDAIVRDELKGIENLPVTLHPARMADARQLYREGLREPSRRNDGMYAIAQTMLHAPEALIPLGYDPQGDPAQQLLKWLESKHNGMSGDYTGPHQEDHAWWLGECQRVVRSAASSAVATEITYPEGWRMLTESEWDRIFSLGSHISTSNRRYRVEVVAACFLRKAKWSVMARKFEAAADGTYQAEIHSDWWAQIPFCKNRKNQRSYREQLANFGLYHLEKRGSLKTKRANMYGGLPLEFGGVQPSLPYSPRELASMAEVLEIQSPVLEYCLVAAQRFPEEGQLRLRYGRGERYILQKIADMERLYTQLTAQAA